MMYNNIALLIGHVVGDYVFQNDWMAKNKTKMKTIFLGVEAHVQDESGIGRIACLVHCAIYAAVVSACVVAGGWRYGNLLCSFLVAYAIAWMTHYPIDRFSLAKKWIDFFGQTKEGPFFPCVYIGVDNGAHLLLMWILFSVLGVR